MRSLTAIYWSLAFVDLVWAREKKSWQMEFPLLQSKIYMDF